MMQTLQQTATELINLPLWAQFLLIGVLLFVGQYWFTQLAGRLSGIQLFSSKGASLLKFLIASLLLAYLLVNFWVGKSPEGTRYEWGIYGRGAFIGITLFLTQFFSRYFAR